MRTNLRTIQTLSTLFGATRRALCPTSRRRRLSRAEQRARPHKSESFTWDETYTLPENLFLAYQRSGDKRYRDLAIRFIEHDYFEPLADEPQHPSRRARLQSRQCIQLGHAVVSRAGRREPTFAPPQMVFA